MLILGLNAYHADSAACLVRDGQLVAAAEEERFRRIKHWAGLPTEAIKYCLREGGVRFGDLDHIAVNRQPGVNNLRRLLFVLRHRPELELIRSKLRNLRAAGSVEEALAAAFPAEKLRARVHHIEHHLAHLASAYLVSDFQEAVCVSVDGFGDFSSAAWGLGRDCEITVDGRIYFPHSLGIFYSAVTQFLGFPYYGDEYKVMGLAPYGQPKYLEQMRELVAVEPNGTYKLNLRYFRHHDENVSYNWKDCAPEWGLLYKPELERLLGPARQQGESLDQRHKDIARSAQARYEEALFALLSSLYERYRCPNLALAGGCAMNSVANGKVYLQTPFKRMYLPAAAGDAGGAIGAAFFLNAETLKTEMLKSGKATGRRDDETAGLRDYGTTGQPDPGSSLPSPLSRSPNGHFVMDHAYTGPGFNEAALEAILREKLGESREEKAESGKQKAEMARPATQDGRETTALRPPPSALTLSRYPDPAALCRRTAQAIADGKVVGWFQGRMEWGPRALGNRSILCDPRRADMKEILNAKIKRRESFRPFAPSILREHVHDWFEQEDDVPFMMQVFQVREEKRRLVPATTHVDGSGRLQTVHRETNPLYHRLIPDFGSLTSVPMVLNTSFNENEPVVCRPEEALDCFLRTQMDVLVLGSFFIERTSRNAEILKS